MSNKKNPGQARTPSLKTTLAVRKEPYLKFLPLFLAVALVLYGHTLGFGYALDDDVVFLKNQFVQSGVSGIGDILSNGFITGFNGTNDQSYRPLVLITFAIEHAIFGNTPSIGHLINLMLYAGCGFLVFRLMQYFFSGAALWVPLSVALLFMVHPVHTEVVANIKGRDDILHFLFTIGALLFLMKYLKRENKKYLAWSALLYFLALLCKEMAVTFLGIIPVTLWFFSTWSWKRIMLNTGLYTAVLAIYLVIRLSVLDGLTFDEDITVINNGLVAANSEADRLASSLVIMGRYVKLLFLPHPLSWDYSFNQLPIVSFTHWQSLLSMALYMGLAIICLRGFGKKDPLAWSILFFVISMSIVSNIFIMLGATMAERFLFTPSLGFATAIVLLLARISKTGLNNKINQRSGVMASVLAVLFLLFSIKTLQRNMVWESNQSLYESGVITAPNSTRTWSALGTSYRFQAETSQFNSERLALYNEALACYQKSITILDDNFESWYNMGVVYGQLGMPGPALAAFRKTVSISPRYANAWNNIGVHYFNLQQYDSAQLNFQRAYDVNPDDGNILANMGLIYHNTGDLTSAIQWYLRGLEADPDNKNTAKNLALAYRQHGEPQKAIIYE